MAREIQDIFIEVIAKTQIDKPGVRRWLDHIGAVDYELPDEATASDSVIGLAAKLCYRSFQPGLNPNVTRVRSDWHEYMENILRSGHGSVLRHATYTFALEGVSRVLTAEMNRHAAGVAISECSMRYIRFKDIPYWLPFAWRPAPGDNPELARKKRQSREILARSMLRAQEDYLEYCGVWDIDNIESFHEKKLLTSAFRRSVPMGVSTGVIYTLNFQALRHIIALRSSPEAEEEIAYVAGCMAKTMVESEAPLFGDFRQDDQGFWRPVHLKVA